MINARLNVKKKQAFASSTAKGTMPMPHIYPGEIHWELDCHVKNMWFWFLQVKKKPWSCTCSYVFLDSLSLILAKQLMPELSLECRPEFRIQGKHCCTLCAAGSTDGSLEEFRSSKKIYKEATSAIRSWTDWTEEQLLQVNFSFQGMEAF